MRPAIRRKPGSFEKLLLLGGVTASTLLGGMLLLTHVPFAAEPAKLDRLALELRSRDPRTPWTAAHVIVGECGCSKLLTARLAARRPHDGFAEHVLWIGDPDPPDVLRTQGYRVTRLDGETAVEQYGLQGAPWLLLADASGTLRYSGGEPGAESCLSAGLSGLDGFLEQAFRGHVPKPRPAFGCAIRRSARRQLDPMGAEQGEWKQR